MEEKTNKDWYPYKSLGSYFKLENGVLLQCPMLIDGSRDNSPCEVDWYAGWHDIELDLGSIVEELEAKP